MSIDNFIWVPDGVRNDNTILFKKYKSLAEMRAGDRLAESDHQVFLAHGEVLIDEQYFFESPDDARWFWLQGYRERLYLDREGKQMHYDRMAIWIGGEEIDQRP